MKTLGAHPSTQSFGIGRQSGKGHAHVIVNGQNLLLVGGQLGGAALEGHQHGVMGVLESDRGRALLDGLHGVLHLMQTSLGRPSRHVAIVLITELQRDTMTALGNESGEFMSETSRLTMMRGA